MGVLVKTRGAVDGWVPQACPSYRANLPLTAPTPYPRPHVLPQVWSESKHNMDIQDIGWLTVSSAIGNMCFSVPMGECSARARACELPHMYAHDSSNDRTPQPPTLIQHPFLPPLPAPPLAGYLFDRVHNKQALLYASSLLAGAAYFTFPAAQGKYAVFAAQALIAGGTGALYTVQCSIVRLVADERVGASMFAAVLGAMNLAAFLGEWDEGRDRELGHGGYAQTYAPRRVSTPLLPAQLHRPFPPSAAHPVPRSCRPQAR